jgi:hypothetical protein
MITIDESMRAVFFVTFAEGADYLATVMVNQDGPGFVVHSRVRWYGTRQTGDPFTSHDHKQWMRASFDQKFDDLLKRLRHIARGLIEWADVNGRQSPDPFIYELVRGEATLDALLDQLFKMPFVHQKRIQ